MSSNQIAIVGMSCNLPGAQNLQQFWNNLHDGIVSTKITQRRNDIDTVGGYIEDISSFDANFFNTSPIEAKHMSPLLRKLLEASYHAIEDSGLTIDELRALNTGVFTVSLPGDYKNLIAKVPESATHPHSFAGNAFSAMSGRISYFYNFSGPSMSIDSACSSGLHALQVAQLSILNHDCDAALVGGASLFCTDEFQKLAEGSQLISQNGSCNPFDNNADGIIPSEGIACLILIRKSIAEEMGLPIYATISSIKLNHNGLSNGIMAPSSSKQAELLSKSYQKNKFSFSKLAIIETHGTGTKLGDPIELKGLKNALLPLANEKNTCYLGALKGNIGHTLVCSSLASTIKLILANENMLIPANPNFKNENQHETLPKFLIINTKPVQWPIDKPFAAVSAFGFTGSNAHMILNFNNVKMGKATKTTKKKYFLFSANSEMKLKEILCNMLTWLKHKSNLCLDHLAIKLMRSPRHFKQYRIAIFAEHHEQLINTIKKIIECNDPLNNFAIYNQKQSRASLTEKEHIKEWLQGGALNLKFEKLSPRRLRLPPYPFDKTIYWISNTNGKVTQDLNSESRLEALKSAVAKILSYNSSEIDSSKSLLELGVDSLSAANIKSELEKIGIQLELNSAWSDKPLSELARLPYQVSKGSLSSRPETDTNFDITWVSSSPQDKHILLLPPLNCDQKAWLRQTKFLNYHGYQTHTPLYPGHHDRSNEIEINLQNIAEKIHEYASKLNGHTHFVGWSLGGVLCQIIAKRNPNNIKSMILISTATQFSDDLFEDTINMQAELEHHSKELQIAFQTSSPISAYISTNSPIYILKEYYLSLKQFKLPLDEVKHIKVPTLLIYGKNDPVISLENNVDLMQIPNCKIKIYENGGHFVPICEPIQFNNELINFIKNNEEEFSHDN